jgi:exodeoxyribonuclease VII large subunit
MPLLPQRIAVISSPTAAGYGDFCHQLQSNSFGFYFNTELFPALMQGNQVEDSVLQALDKIHARIDEFDVVVIIRGGGATSDLSGFDTYLLAASCAQFPLPVITGIGHERDDTVLDSVAHTRVKTPTAAAEYLVARMSDAAAQLLHWAEQLRDVALNRMEEEKQRLMYLQRRIPSTVVSRLSAAKMQLLTARKDMHRAVQVLLTAQKHRLELVAQRVEGASPERLLQRGYSLTLKEGKVVTDATSLREGDRLTTRLAKGEVESVISKVNS